MSDEQQAREACAQLNGKCSCVTGACESMMLLVENYGDNAVNHELKRMEQNRISGEFD